MTVAPAKRRRPRVWDDAQVIEWIVHRTEWAVVDAEGMLKTVQAEWAVVDAKEREPLALAEGKVSDARKGKPKKASLGFYLAVWFEGKNPYFADGTPIAGRIAGLYPQAEKEFMRAKAKGQLRKRDKDHFNAKEVRAIWPGRGRGNAKKPYFDRRLVNKTAALIIDGPDEQTRSEVIQKLGPGFRRKTKQSALLRAAIDTAIRLLKSGEPPPAALETIPPVEEGQHPPESVLETIPPVEEGQHSLEITPKKAKELLTRDIPERARKGLEQIARMKQLSPREQKAQIRRVESFEKRALRSASN